MTDYYIGLMSGTSMDGIDAALVSFEASSVNLVQTLEHRYPDDLRNSLLRAVREPQRCTVDDIGALDRRVGLCFRDAGIAIQEGAGIDAARIRAIGSHGQTLRHQPDAPHPFTMQIGAPSIIAAGTGITTIANFRSSDMAHGGQGAPLVPPFHEWLFHEAGKRRVVLNIGGMANITVLAAGDEKTTGFDTGPGNTLLDAWIERHMGKSFDKDGAWSASGEINKDLLARLLADPYFRKPPPKSTGFEYFNLDWLEAADIAGLDPVDVQATLCSLTAASVAMAIQTVAPKTSEVFVCGGGAKNREIMRALEATLPDAQLKSTVALGLDPSWVEAAAFAWLAMRTLHGLPGNLPSVTGASRATILGAIYRA